MKNAYVFALEIAILLFMSCFPPPQQSLLAPVDFGTNVRIFDPSMSTQEIQKQIAQVFSVQEFNQFGPQRFALLFKPGKYSGLDLPVGFYTQIVGLGDTPDAVEISGNLHSDAYLSSNNATCNFWRGAEGITIAPSSGEVQWAVAQATSLRRMHIRGNIRLDQNGGWSSGGWMSDVKVDGTVDSGSQQQWISRNCQFGGWNGSHWNMVFVGVTGAPAQSWPSPPYTTIDKVPVSREKPFLTVDDKGTWGVRVPGWKTDSYGLTWNSSNPPGKTIPLEDFYVARAGIDTAESINEHLAAGKNLILTPGIYTLDDTIRVERADTVVLGLGYATLLPRTGRAALTVADVEGVTVSGILFDAGVSNSPVLVRIGSKKSAAISSQNPVVLHDTFFRVGGADVGKATVCLEINAAGTVVDHTWIWRADHGLAGTVGWEVNTAETGLVVNADDVTIYGLFVEHFRRHQVVWNGERGRVYFYQSEIPYDPPNQASWTSEKGVDGWASYKVANSVARHEAWGLGIYSVFSYPEVSLSRAIESPHTEGVKFHDAITVCIGSNGGIAHVINNFGDATIANVAYTPKVTDYP